MNITLLVQAVKTVKCLAAQLSPYKPLTEIHLINAMNVLKTVDTAICELERVAYHEH